MAEVLNAAVKRQVIDRFLQQIMREHPDYYYAPTVDIARAIESRIKADFNRLSIEEQVLFKRITVRDIEILLSIQS